MTTNGVIGVNGAPKREFDPNFTQNVINATGPNALPRLKQVLPSLIRYLHDFLRENEITITEFMAACNLLNEAGKWSDDRRNEGQILWDILGVESLCDEITYKLATEGNHPTPSAVLGPFWRQDAPKYKMGDSIMMKKMDGDYTYMFGSVLDFETNKPIEGVELDVWQGATNGLYEQQDPDQPDMNLRGRFTTGPDGKYSFYCLRPTPYPIPNDGPGNKFLQLLDRHPYRPGHIHFILTAPGYRPIVTQLFDSADKYVKDDSVFAVKDSLVVDFVPRKGDEKAQFQLPYDFMMAKLEGTA